jgi:hypothetical protein
MQLPVASIRKWSRGSRGEIKCGRDAAFLSCLGTGGRKLGIRFVALLRTTFVSFCLVFASFAPSVGRLVAHDRLTLLRRALSYTSP